jgi:hypothetical protein
VFQLQEEWSANWVRSILAGWLWILLLVGTWRGREAPQAVSVEKREAQNKVMLKLEGGMKKGA